VKAAGFETAKIPPIPDIGAPLVRFSELFGWNIPLKILLTGAQGQLGLELAQALSVLGEVVALGRAELDLADAPTLRALLLRHKPEVIVNAAAYTAVDRAEAEPELARAVNATAPAVMAEVAHELDALLIHFSTDYVFDGRKEGGWLESDLPNPLNVYGRSKWEGEQAILATGASALIFRTSWVYGLGGANFMSTMLRLGGQREELRMVNDQWGAPTWTRSIARALVEILTRPKGFLQQASGVYHMTNGGRTNWYEYAQAIFGLHPGCTARLIPIPAAEYPSAALRPTNSCLDNGKLKRVFGVELPPWHDALVQCLSELS
jgi:dTDP-4-dehydrorhamnose reductase